MQHSKGDAAGERGITRHAARAEDRAIARAVLAPDVLVSAAITEGISREASGYLVLETATQSNARRVGDDR